jgi:hypothetical protein
LREQEWAQAEHENEQEWAQAEREQGEREQVWAQAEHENEQDWAQAERRVRALLAAMEAELARPSGLRFP